MAFLKNPQVAIFILKAIPSGLLINYKELRFTHLKSKPFKGDYVYFYILNELDYWCYFQVLFWACD
jgi:hypothetical protein